MLGRAKAGGKSHAVCRIQGALELPPTHGMSPGQSVDRSRLEACGQQDSASRTCPAHLTGPWGGSLEKKAVKDLVS